MTLLRQTVRPDASRERMENEIAAFLASEAGAAAKKLLFAFRLWCVVELHAALEAGIPVVIRAGKAAREGDAVKFDTEGADDMLENLSNMIDVERAECAVRADYDREMDAVRNGEGVETVNKRVAGAVLLERFAAVELLAPRRAMHRARPVPLYVQLYIYMYSVLDSEILN